MPVAIINTQDSNEDASAANEDADVFVPFFGDKYDLTNPSWWVEECWGVHPGQENEHAIVHCMNDAVDEDGYSVAFNLEGIASKLLPGTNMAIKKRSTDSNGEEQYEVVFIGYVAQVDHVSAVDELKLTCYSLKDKLRDIKIVGSWCWDGTAVVYRRGVDLMMNPGGRPYWIRSPDRFGGVWMPAPYPDFGISGDIQPPDQTMMSSTIATYGTLGMAIEYLRVFHGAIAGAALTDDMLEAIALARSFYPDVDAMRAPSWLIWGNGLGETIGFQTDNQGNAILGSARKGREIIFDGGMGLIGDRHGKPGVLDLLYDAEGFHSYAVEPFGADAEDFQCQLIEVPLRPIPTADNPGITFYYSNNAPADVPIFTAPTIGLSVADTVTRVLGRGSRVKVEARFAGPTYLTPAWTTVTQTAVLTDAVTRTGDAFHVQPDAFAWAIGQHPTFLARWMFSTAIDWQDDTEYAGFPQAQHPRPVMPHLLSFQSSENVVEDIVHYPIYVEIFRAGQWEPVQDAVSIIAWDNGMVEIPAFRSLGIAADDSRPAAVAPNYASVTNGALDITLNPIRFTAAVNLDQCLESGLVSPHDEGDDVSDPAAANYLIDDDALDATKIAPGFSRSMFLDLKTLYQQWISHKSAYAFPESQGGESTETEFGGTIDIRKDDVSLQTHVQKRMRANNRLAITGPLIVDGYLTTMYPTGLYCNAFAPYVFPAWDDPEDPTIPKPFPIDFVVLGKRWRTERVVDDKTGNETFKNSTEIIPG